jgi:hypothetical protein
VNAAQPRFERRQRGVDRVVLLVLDLGADPEREAVGGYAARR